MMNPEELDGIRTALIDRKRQLSDWVEHLREDSVADSPAPEPSEPADPERLAALQRALQELPPRDRLILQLFHLDGAGYKEIADLLGLSMNAVSPALIRARQRIRALLEGQG